MQNISQTRLRKELADLEHDPPPGIVCYPIDDGDITHLESFIKGPPDSPFEHGTFRLDIKITENYPFDPPQMRFKTKIYHPNIDEGGRICADILKKGAHGGWKPSLNLSTTLLSLQSLLSGPNPDDPLDAEIAQEYMLDYERFARKAKEFTMRYATGSSIEIDSTTNTKESSSHQDSPSSCLDGINEIMFNDKAQKGKKSSLSLSSRKRKKTSFVHDQLEPDHVFSSKSQSESSGTMDQLSPLSDSPIHYTSPPSVNLVEDVSSPTSSNSEVVCIATQDSGAITSAMSGTDIPVPEPSGALQQPIPLSYPPTAAQTFEEPENIDLKEKHDNDIPSNNTDEAEVSSSRRAAQPVGGNEDNEGSEARKRNIASVMPDILRNIPVNIIHLDDGPETSPGLIKKKNKLSLSRTKRQKHQN